LKHINYKRIFVYLFNILPKIDFYNFKLSNKFIEIFNKIIENNIKYLSVYQKHRAWEAICSILIRSEISLNNEVIKLLGNFFNFLVFKYLNTLVSLENVNLLDMSSVYNSEPITEAIVKFTKIYTTDSILEV